MTKKRMSAEEYKSMMKGGRKSKFMASSITFDGIRFASKTEGAYYVSLLWSVRSGVLKFFLRQVPFHLPGGVKYVCDFVEFYSNGEIKFVDVKGFETPMFKLKRKQVEALYPIKIEVVK